jgi:uncharacterized protein (TIGR02246 family)
MLAEPPTLRCIAAAVMYCPPSEVGMNTDEDSIRRLIATWLDASNAGDTRKVLDLMADDVVFLMPGRPPMRGKSMFEASQRDPGAASLQATSDIQQIEVFGDWAYAWAKLTVVMTPRGGEPVKRAGSTLSIFRKDNGTWLLYRDANMLAVETGTRD